MIDLERRCSLINFLQAKQCSG